MKRQDEPEGPARPHQVYQHGETMEKREKEKAQKRKGVEDVMTKSF